LGVKEKTKRCAFDILKQANSKRILSGSKPAVVCAGALYLACIANDENIPQITIAEKVQVSSPSIRKALSVLNKALSVV
jgi:transcription initiation factor TFIIIB Brf1 subunit/transcription initiation factor TFIIB